jgi:hypothetical protein
MPTATSDSLGRMTPSMLAVVAGAGLLFAATIALWAYHGTAVFYEMILAGLAACF